MPDGIFFSDTGDRAEARRIQRLAASGRMRKIHEGIYTDNMSDPISKVAIDNAFKIAAHLCGQAILSGRSALAGRPCMTDERGVRAAWFFLVDSQAKRRRDIEMPGLTLRIIPGPGQQPGDYPLMGLVMPSLARLLLENLQPSRARKGSGPTRTSGRTAVEEKLERIGTIEGEPRLNQLRDEARELARALEMTREFGELEDIIGTLLGTRKAKLVAPTSQAAASGNAYDPDCVRRLMLLKKHLEDVALPDYQDGSTSGGARAAACFIEGYFSNYIEGTRFPVRQAGRIVFEEERPAARPKDSHDVVATYMQLVNMGDRRPSSLSSDDFLAEIRGRHKDLMAARPETSPGEWKSEANIAGNTTFVLPQYVPGTLRAGLDILRGLRHPFAHAVFIHFLIADVHPFSDGNGRISRIMMSKELVGSGLSRIVVPTVYRENYLNGLRSLSRSDNPAVLVRTLEFCQKVTASCSAPTVEAAVELWASAYAFLEAGANARLEMPDLSREVVWNNEVPAPKAFWDAEGRQSSDIQF